MARLRFLSVALSFVVVVVAGGLVASAELTEPINAGARCCASANRLAPPEPPPPVSDPVFIIGDSLFVGIVSPQILGGANTIQARLAATGRTVFTSAETGRQIPEAIDVLRWRSAEVAEAGVVLVGLGTNDLFGSGGSSVAGARRHIDSMVGAVRDINPDVRLVWVDVSVERSADRTTNWNTGLNDAATEIAGVEVCAWRERALANPSWFASDDIHLTVTGYRARRDIAIACLLTTSQP